MSKKGIPIAPTFIVRDDRDPKNTSQSQKEGWKSFVLKPHRAYANIGIGKFDRKMHLIALLVTILNLIQFIILKTLKKISEFLNKHSCSQRSFARVMDGFAKF